MCGIAGIVTAGPPSERLLTQMAIVLAHRGPDDMGVWTDDAAGVGFAHRRLSIVDLSPMGHQPMVSSDGRWVISFNGEIYNHLDLRRELDGEGHGAWRGHSDTETLCEGIARWGLRQTLERAVGMFALAVWDRKDRLLSLARDRFGEKPLYYGWVGGDFVFASELSALRVHPGFCNAVSRAALGSLTSMAYVAEPLSIYEGIFKLTPGTILTAASSALRTPRGEAFTTGDGLKGITVKSYWSYKDVVSRGLADPFTDEDEALITLEKALEDAIAGQAVADVPVGAFLSGGVDSSLITAIYQKKWPGKVKTFTVGFDDKTYDEAPFARRIADHLGTDHHEAYLSAHDALDLIGKIPSIYDEPFADSSQIPTYFVSKIACRDVTVALSGDGGDELFGGYNRYIGAVPLWEALQRVPKPMRQTAGRLLALCPPSMWNVLAAMVRPSPRLPSFYGGRIQKTLDALGRADRFEDFAALFLDEASGGDSAVIGAPQRPPLDMSFDSPVPDVARMMYSDATSYLPGDILAKVDRAAMVNSLETRVPFLDHRVAVVAARIPLSMKIAGGSGKVVLRKLLYRHLPETFFLRPKAGFAVPLADWLRGPLRDWGEALIAPSRLQSEGYFDTAQVQKRWRALLSGHSHATGFIWSVLMTQAWLDHQRSKPILPGKPAQRATVQKSDA